MKRPAVLWALSGFFAVAAAAASVRLVTLSGELADLEAERDRLLRQREAPPRDEESAARVRTLEERIRILESQTSTYAPAPRRAASDLEDWEKKRDDERRRREAQRAMDEGLKTAWEGRYELSEGHFARVLAFDATAHLPLYYLCYLALTTSNWLQALDYLKRVIATGDGWLRRAPHPLALFRTREAYAKYLAGLEAHVAANPADASAKALLAFHYYFAKSGTHAKAMASEALSADPDHSEAQAIFDELSRDGH